MTAVLDKQQVAVQLQALETEVTRRRLLSSLDFFVRRFWKYVEPSMPYEHNWHLDVLDEVITKSLTQPQRVIVNVPPGTMKSLRMSVFARAWLWAHDASLRFLVASYGAHLSVRDNVRLRAVVTSPEYQQFFPHVQLTEDQATKLRFETKEGGWSVATSVGGVGTGEHPDYVIIDDPLTAQQAESSADREEANDWLDRTISSRGVTRGVRIWLIMQRLHVEDPTAHLLSKGDYEHICFPMHFDPRRADPKDVRRYEGELLWPSLFTKKIVERLQHDLLESSAAQLEQDPQQSGTALFDRSWFQVVDALPTQVKRRCRGWDTAATSHGDYTVGVRMSEDLQGVFYVEDVVRGRWNPAGVEQQILSTAEIDGTSCAVREEKEGGSAGAAVTFARARALRKFDYEGVPTAGSKAVRAKPFRTQCAAGNVRVLRAAWTQEYVNELCNFRGDGSGNDDQVDGSSCAYNELIKLPSMVASAPTGVGAGQSYWGSL